MSTTITRDDEMAEQLVVLTEIWNTSAKWEFDEVAGSCDLGVITRKGWDLFNWLVENKLICLHCGSTEVVGDSDKCADWWMD